MQGKKTYLIALAMGLVQAFVFLGWLSQDSANSINGFLLPGGLAALRAGVDKVA